MNYKFIIFALCLLILTGCSQDKTAINIILPTELNSVKRGWFSLARIKYQRIHPEVKVRIAYGADGIVQLQAFPDITTVNEKSIESRPFSNQHYDLTPQLIKTKWLSKIIPFLLKKGIIDGRLYALPLWGDFTGVFYNLDILKSAGINIKKPDELPKTWVEMVNLAWNLHNKNPDIIPFAWTSKGKETAYYFYSLASLCGGTLLRYNGKRVQLDLLSEPAIEAARQLNQLSMLPYAEFFRENHTQKDLINLFLQGKTAILWGNVEAVSESMRKNKEVKADNLAITLLPAIKVVPNTMFSADYLAIPNTVSPDELPTIIDFISFLYTEEIIPIYDHRQSENKLNVLALPSLPIFRRPEPKTILPLISPIMGAKEAINTLGVCNCIYSPHIVFNKYVKIKIFDDLTHNLLTQPNANIKNLLYRAQREAESEL